MSYKKHFLAASIIAASTVFSGCIDKINATEPETTPKATQQSQLIDSYAIGVTYKAMPSGKTGVTDKLGYFDYEEGDTVTFSIGGIVLGQVDVNTGTITPYDITANAVEAINVAQLLQSLDADGNAENGIQITPEVVAYITDNNLSLDMSDSAFDTAANNLVAELGALVQATTLVDETAAQTHMDNTIGNTFTETLKMVSFAHQLDDTRPETTYTDTTTLVKNGVWSAGEIENMHVVPIIISQPVIDQMIDDLPENTTVSGLYTWDWDFYINFNADTSFTAYSYEEADEATPPKGSGSWGINAEGNLFFYWDDTSDLDNPAAGDYYAEAVKVAGIEGVGEAILYRIWDEKTSKEGEADLALLGDMINVSDPFTSLSVGTNADLTYLGSNDLGGLYKVTGLEITDDHTVSISNIVDGDPTLIIYDSRRAASDYQEELLSGDCADLTQCGYYVVNYSANAGTMDESASTYGLFSSTLYFRIVGEQASTSFDINITATSTP
ncbi:MAG: hypothetical protein HRU20_06580 [Pseudomonadales bacterium]|nr:hypothetical protein [Pseudomonadales bacterium]